MKKRMTIWRLIAKSLGEKSGKDNVEADKIALVRLCMFLSILITNTFIVAGVIKHWNDETIVNVEVSVDEGNIPSILSKTQKEEILSTNRRRFPYD